MAGAKEELKAILPHPLNLFHNLQYIGLAPAQFLGAEIPGCGFLRNGIDGLTISS